MCQFAATTLVCMPLHMFYSSSLATDLGLRKFISFGSREERGLLSLNKIFRMSGTGEQCCLGDCAGILREAGMKRHWGLYEAAKTVKDQDLVLLMVVLWSVTFCRAAPWCNLHLTRVFGVEGQRTSRVRSVLALFEEGLGAGEFPELMEEHGNSGKVPANAKPAHIKKALIRCLERNSTWNPSSATLLVHGGAKLAGGSVIAKRFKIEDPDESNNVSDMTLNRWIEKHLINVGVRRVRVLKPGHNMCGECTENRSELERAVKKEASARHALEDAAAAKEHASAAVEAAEAAVEAVKEAAAVGGGGGGQGMDDDDHDGGGALASALHEAIGTLSSAQSALSAASDEREVAAAAGEEHLGVHYEMADMVSRLQGLAQAFRARRALQQQQAASSAAAVGAGGGAAGAEKAAAAVAPRSQALIEVTVVDDKSAVDLPAKPQEETGVMSKISVGVNGQCSLTLGTGNIYCPDSSGSGKTSDSVLNECALDHLVNGSGARVFVMISDMGPLNHNLAVTVLFSQFLCDIGLYDMVIVGYLQRLHSKQLCDRM